MQCNERFVVLMYSEICDCATVNNNRHTIFSNNIRSSESISSTQTAFYQISRDPCFKLVLSGSSHLWSMGWERNEVSRQWLPCCTTLAHGRKACAALLIIDGTTDKWCLLMLCQTWHWIQWYLTPIPTWISFWFTIFVIWMQNVIKYEPVTLH